MRVLTIGTRDDDDLGLAGQCPAGHGARIGMVHRETLASAVGPRVARADVPEVGWTALDTDDADLCPPGPWFQFHPEVTAATAHRWIRNDPATVTAAGHDPEALIAAFGDAEERQARVRCQALLDGFLKRAAAEPNTSDDGLAAQSRRTHTPSTSGGTISCR